MPSQKRALRLAPLLLATLMLLAACGNGAGQSASTAAPAATYTLSTGLAGNAAASSRDVYFVLDDVLYQSDGKTCTLLNNDTNSLAGAGSDGAYTLFNSINVPNGYEGPPVLDFGLCTPSGEAGYILRDVSGAVLLGNTAEYALYLMEDASGRDGRMQIVIKRYALATGKMALLFADAGIALGGSEAVFARDFVLYPASGGGALVFLLYEAPSGEALTRGLLFGADGTLLEDTEEVTAAQMAALAAAPYDDWKDFTLEYDGMTIRAVEADNGFAALEATLYGQTAPLQATAAGNFLVVQLPGRQGFVVDARTQPYAVVSTANAAAPPSESDDE